MTCVSGMVHTSVQLLTAIWPSVNFRRSYCCHDVMVGARSVVYDNIPRFSVSLRYFCYMVGDSISAYLKLPKFIWFLNNLIALIYHHTITARNVIYSME